MKTMSKITYECPCGALLSLEDDVKACPVCERPLTDADRAVPLMTEEEIAAWKDYEPEEKRVQDALTPP